MSLKEQINKLKENWLILSLVVLLILFISGGDLLPKSTNALFRSGFVTKDSYIVAETGLAKSYYPGSSNGNNFAPEISERQITKTARLNTEVKRNTFYENEAKLKEILSSSDSYLLNENVNKYGTDLSKYVIGTYQIKVDTTKYSSVITQLKEIGEVNSFNENAQDITGQYTDLNSQLKLEKERLARYEKMYGEAEKVSDKITLNDKIFSQERTITYLEKSIENLDNKISYSTIYFTMQEKQSEYKNAIFIKFSELVRRLVDSINNLFSLVVILLPWAIASVIIKLFWKIFTRKHRKK